MGEPNLFVPVALAAFALAVAVCFSRLPPARAWLFCLLGGWLFLPHFDGRYRVSVLTTKGMFVAASVLLASLLFDRDRWRTFRPRILDLPLAALCLAPFATALANDLGLKEAGAAAAEVTLTMGGPYLLGRLYLGGPLGARRLAVPLVVAGLAYVPLCLWEIRMSPQLHLTLYGFRSWSFVQSYRFGGFRPSVFLQHGLAVGIFMAVATLVAYWLARTGAVREVAGLPLSWCWPVLAVTTVLCKSAGAIILLFVGLGVLEGLRRFRAAFLVLALAAMPPLYCAARIAGWEPTPVVNLAAKWLGRDRAGSVQYRVDNERLLIQKALERPWLGWGRFGRSFVYDEDGRSLGAVVDSLWILALGINGLVGLLAIGAVLILPPLALARVLPPRQWASPHVAPVAALSVGLLLWAVDGLLNAMPNPVFPAAAGALVSIAAGARSGWRAAARMHPRAAIAAAPPTALPRTPA